MGFLPSPLRHPIKPFDPVSGRKAIEEEGVAIDECISTFSSVCQTQAGQTSALEGTSRGRPSTDTGTADTNSITSQPTTTSYVSFTDQSADHIFQTKHDASTAMIQRLFRFTVMLMFLSNIVHTASGLYNDSTVTTTGTPSSPPPASAMVLFITLVLQASATSVGIITDTFMDPPHDVEAVSRRKRYLASHFAVFARLLTAAVPMVCLVGVGLLALEVRALTPKLFQMLVIGGARN